MTIRHPWGTVRLRSLAVLILDSSAVALSLYAALQLRVPGQWTEAMRDGAAESALVGVIVSIFIFRVAGIYRHSWRYISLKELIFLSQACVVTVATSSIMTLLLLSDPAWLPRSVPIIQWFVLVVLLGSLRAGRRVVRELMHPPHRTERTSGTTLHSRLRPGSLRQDVLLIGDTDWADSVLRVLKGGRNAALTPVGILTHEDGDLNLNIHGVPILGTIDNLEKAFGEL